MKLKFQWKDRAFLRSKNIVDYLEDLVVSIRDICRQSLGFEMKSYGKSSAFYSKTTCCLIDGRQYLDEHV